MIVLMFRLDGHANVFMLTARDDVFFKEKIICHSKAFI